MKGQMKGKVKVYDPGKGYGFIMAEDGREYLFYFTAVQDRRGDIRAGVDVVFDSWETPKGLEAADVRLMGGK